MLRLITWIATLRVFVHRKKAHAHESTLSKIDKQKAQLRDRVINDRTNTTTALRVLTEEAARLDALNERLS